MRLTDEQVRELERFTHRDRYVPFDADGACYGYVGWTQRPTALRHAEQAGAGLYDIKEGRVILEPDVEKRLTKLRESREHLESRIAEVDERLTSILDARYREALR